MICSICYNNNIDNDIKCECCEKSICNECYSNLIFPNFDVIQSHYLYDKSLSYKCPFCIHSNNTQFIDNNTHRNVIMMLLILKIQKEEENIELLDEVKLLKNKILDLEKNN